MPKKTALDDNAEIYQIREQKTEKEKLRELPRKKMFEYLWEYYRLHAFGFIAGIALIIYIIYQIATPNIETIFYATLINNTIHEDVIDEAQTDFAEHLVINPDLEQVIFNTSFYFSTSPDYVANSKQVLSTYIAAQEVDVLIAPESEFQTYAYNGFLDKLSDQIPTDLYSALADYFYMSDQEEDPEQSVYGIYLTDSELFKNNAVNNDPYVLGIVVNGQHRENSIEFLRYLFDIYP